MTNKKPLSNKLTNIRYLRTFRPMHATLVEMTDLTPDQKKLFRKALTLEIDARKSS